MDHAKYIAALKASRAERADSVMSVGSHVDAAYTFGRECGINTGLRMAEQILIQMVQEEQEKDL